jgi:hypothetical protein
MKKILYALLLMVSAFNISGCRDEDKLPYPKTEEYPVIFTTITAGQSAYRVADANGGSNPSATFAIDVKGNTESVDVIEIYRSFRGFNVPTSGTAVVGLGPRVLLRTVTPTSTSVEVNINDIINGLTRANGPLQVDPRIPRVPITRASLRATEGFLITYELVLKDGRRVVYTPLSGGVVSGTSSSAPYAGVINITN